MLSQDDIRKFISLLEAGRSYCFAGEFDESAYRVPRVTLYFYTNEAARDCYKLLSQLEQESLINHLSEQEFRHRTIIMHQEIEQTLGKALGYPELYPDVSQIDNGTVCVGDNVPETLAQEAAGRIQWLREKNAALEEEMKRLRQYELLG